MKNKRVFQFAIAGLLAGLTLELVGYRLDHLVPRLALENQVIYNWLTLFFSPVAFVLRLANPDGPIVGGWTTFFVALFSNVILYAAFCRAGQLFFARLQHKLTHENIPDAARLHPERVIRVSPPNWRPRSA